MSARSARCARVRVGRFFTRVLRGRPPRGRASTGRARPRGPRRGRCPRRPPPRPVSTAAAGGKATRDALRGLALQFETWDFVATRDREAARRRETSDALDECLRTFQLCASPKLTRRENVLRVLPPALLNFSARLLARVGRVLDRGVARDVDRAVRAVADAESSLGGDLALDAEIERRARALASDLLSGWKGEENPGAPPEEDPEGADPSGGGASPPASSFASSFAARARRLADETLASCVSCVSASLTPRENVDRLVTPRVLGHAARLTHLARPDAEVSGEAAELALGACERVARRADQDPSVTEALDALDALEAFERAAPNDPNARAPSDRPLAGFGIAALRALGGSGFGASSLFASDAAGAGEPGRRRLSEKAAARAALESALRDVLRAELPRALDAIAPGIRAAARLSAERAATRAAAREARARARGGGGGRPAPARGTAPARGNPAGLARATGFIGVLLRTRRSRSRGRRRSRRCAGARRPRRFARR